MIFLDTNIWNYAILSQGQEKRTRARQIIAHALSSNDFAISTQVISECVHVLQKKGMMPARDVLRVVHYMRHVGTVVQLTPEIIARAIELAGVYCLSLYDAQIIAAAEKAGCREIWTEDLQTGAIYSNIRCVNPFASDFIIP